MSHRKRALLPALTAVLAACLLMSCARAPKTPPPPDIVAVNAGNYSSEVIRQPGVTLVLFHNLEAWQSQDMYQRLAFLSQTYKGRLKFCAFAWDTAADPAPYRLEMLPTLVMYRDGYEVDRMRGIPDNATAMAALNDDLELWILRTGLKLTQDPTFQAAFSYRFKNGVRLIPENDL
jgi:thioredoxin-like negative regulator of GroEL